MGCEVAIASEHYLDITTSKTALAEAVAPDDP